MTRHISEMFGNQGGQPTMNDPHGYNDRAPLPMGEITHPVYLPVEPTPVVHVAPVTVQGALQAQVTSAEQRLQRRHTEHADAIVRLDTARQLRAARPDADDTRTGLVNAKAALDLAKEEVDAAQAALDLARTKLKDLSASGVVAEFEQCDREQGAEAFNAALAPLQKRAQKLGRDFAGIVGASREMLTRVGTARHRAMTIARELGITGYRPTSLNIDDVARALGQAFRKGFTEGGERDSEVAFWTRG
jgi:hypothetical protein